jgi:hypothetical protein
MFIINNIRGINGAITTMLRKDENFKGIGVKGLPMFLD